VHSRAAEEAIIKTLAKHAHVPVMLHSFGGDLDLANLAVKEGFYFSVAPIIVRSNKHKNLIEFLPIDRILTETDSPYLGPTKERNDPRNIPIIIEEIANIKKISTESVREQVLKNSREVFKF
jgi:TatD DNase family protein